MKRLLILSLCTVVTTTITLSSACALDERSDYPTRTLNARHALSTSSPEYADKELEGDDRQEEVEAFNELDAQREMETREGIIPGDHIRRDEGVPAENIDDALDL